ncbi:MAG: hypothetical protein ACOY3I_08985 [Verrucomicrobiota bacterium]
MKKWLCCLVVVLSSLGWAQQKEGGEAFIKEVKAFGTSAVGDVQKAFSNYANDAGQKAFAKLQGVLCSTTPSDKAWAYFFDTSLYYAKFLNAQTAVVIHYNVWSDVALITEWKKSKGGIKISDAELLMGDFIRNKGKPPFDPDPLWLRSSMPASATPPFSTASTLKAFEANFSETTPKSWRTMLPNVENAQAMQANHQTVGWMFERNMDTLSQLVNNKDIAKLHAETLNVFKKLAQGDAEGILKIAKATPPESAQALRMIPTQWSKAKVVAFMQKRDEQKKNHWFILCSLPGSPELLMSLWFKDEATLYRVDFADQCEAFKNFEQIKKIAKRF